MTNLTSIHRRHHHHLAHRLATQNEEGKDADAIGLGAEDEHFYLMTGVEAGRLVARNPSRLGQFVSSGSEHVLHDQEQLFITNVGANKGIQCRFGMKGVIAEAHYDGGRNMVAMLKGAKRYILNPPSECSMLDIIADKAHPSYRHSRTDWSNEDEAKRQGFANARGIDTIVHEGEILYIPSYWFHYIISLDYSIQCNSRSEPPPNANNEHHIHKCMGRGSTPPKRQRKLGKKVDAPPPRGCVGAETPGAGWARACRTKRRSKPTRGLRTEQERPHESR